MNETAQLEATPKVPTRPSGWFAGIHSVRGGSGAGAVERVAHVSGGRIFADGPLTVAVGHDAPARNSGSACVIAGRAFGIDALATTLGLDSATPAKVVLLEGFRRFGPEVLTHLTGDYAVLLWDADRERGLVGQDQMAVSGIFVKQTAEGFAFATEIRELLRLLPTRPAPDLATISLHLVPAPLQAGRTLFDGVRRLESGTCLLLERDRATVEEYWSLSYEGTLRLSREELSARVREQVRAAVNRAAGDAETVGVLLSGGFDSSLVASVAAEQGRDVRGYSAVFPSRPELDESAYVESIEEQWGIHRCTKAIPPHGSLLTALKYLDAWQVPVFGPGYVIEHTLVEAMRRDAPLAVLDGQGGDELFGSSFYLPAHLIQRGRILQSVKMMRRTPSTSEVESVRELYAMWKRYALKPAFPLPLVEARERRQGPRPSPQWLTPSARELYLESSDGWSWRRRSRGPLWWRWMVYVAVEGPVIAGRSDYVRHRSALGGLDGGPPLMDFELGRLALRIPPNLGFDPTYDRPFGRQAMGDILPDRVRRRKDKSNLFSFYRDVLAGPDLVWMRRLLRDPSCRVWDFVERSKLDPYLENVPPDPDEKTSLLLSVLHSAVIVECWLRQQEDADAVPTLIEELSAAGGAGA